MKKIFSLLVLFLIAGSLACAEGPVPLSPIKDLRSLSKSQAEQGRSVSLEGTVTFYFAQQRNLFLQDGDEGIFVKATTGTKLVPGDRVLVKGTTAWGYGVKIFSSDITVLGHGALPKPLSANFDGLIKGRFDTRLVSIRGVVHAADMEPPSGGQPPALATLSVLLDGGYVEVQIVTNDTRALKDLLDSEVEIIAVAGGKFDGKLRLTGVFLHSGSLSDIKVLNRAAISPWSLPFTPMDKVLGAYFVKNLTNRVRVTGTVTYFDPGSGLVIQNDNESIWVKTRSYAPIKIGNQVEVVGFPTVSDGFLVLGLSEIQDKGISAPVSPTPMTWQQLAASRSIFDLVSIQGQVVTEAREASQDEYVLASDGHMFSAINVHGNNDEPLAPMKRIPVGARVRVTGICATQNSNPFGHNVPFNILLRSPDDILILAEPSPLTVRNLGLIAIGLLLLVLALGTRAWFVGRNTRARLAELGYLSQRRGEILEDINNSRPVNGILERITELASVSLKGAPCWCEMDGVRLGNRPPELGSPGLRIADHAIGHHGKPAFGTLFAAFDARTTPQTDEDRALATAADLATLAVENSRFHSELLHRSEFDMLTEIQNRFSFDKCIAELIDSAQMSSQRFGLIYIDLNDFKQVNDRHGHQVGDKFLQHVAERMKHQLRPGDVLARMGGDEFAVLVPLIHQRSDAQDIAARLEQSFSEPFRIDDHALRGSASFGIAVYPDDASTKEGLLTIADHAMYVEKQTWHRLDDELGHIPKDKLESEPRA